MKIGKTIQLKDLNGGTLSTTVSINFSLETNAAQLVMDGIEKDLSRIHQSKIADFAQKGVDVANQGSGVVNVLSPSIQPLGDVLQAIVKIMDSIEDVGDRGFPLIATLIISFLGSPDLEGCLDCALVSVQGQSAHMFLRLWLKSCLGRESTRHSRCKSL